MDAARRALECLHAGDGGSPEDLCARLGEELGLDGPAPLAVTRRALVDEVFAADLANGRGDTQLLALLFADRRNQRYEDERDVPEPPALSNVALAARAGTALARWGSGGFGKVAPEVFAARFGACQACDHLVDPPDRVAYRVRLRQASDPRVCAACGCVASRKAALPTEHCPLPDPDDPTRTRWGDPR